MFNQLLQLVEQHAGSSIINNPAISDQHNTAAIQSVTQTIFSQLQNHATSGNMQQIIALFQNGGGSSLSGHPIISNMISSVAGNLSTQYGVSSPNAQSMANNMVPAIMSQLISQTNNPNNSSFTITSVLQSVSGNNNLNIGNLLSQFSNSNSNGALGILGNLASKFFGK